MTEAASSGADTGESMVVMGRVSGVFGVRGWLRIYSEAEPVNGILDYSPWYLRIDGQWHPFDVLEGRPHGKGVVVRLRGINDRDAAAGYVQCEIAVPHTELPALEEGDYYWADLIGLQVQTTAGVELGRVVDLMETGANDVLVVRGERERLIPYDPEGVIEMIDLAAGRMTVDWDPEF